MQTLNLLRSHTAQLHEELDRAISTFAFGTRSGYISFLELNAKIVFPLEAWLKSQKHYASLPGHLDRLRSDALREDLATLDRTPPQPAHLTFVKDDLSVAGVTYVLEGSRLGSRHISSLMKKSGQRVPTRFLGHGRGEKYWATFLKWLGEQDDTDGDRTVEAAQNVFRAYIAQANLVRQNGIVDGGQS